MQLHLLGHVHFTRDGRNVVVSSKSAALLTYLVLERQAHHREHLAELLWDTADPLRNLRVELARLKRDGVTTFPERQPMLHFACLTDLDPWTEAAPQVDDAHLLGCSPPCAACRSAAWRTSGRVPTSSGWKGSAGTSSSGSSRRSAGSGGA